jgi:hypothetical protein
MEEDYCIRLYTFLRMKCIPCICFLFFFVDITDQSSGPSGLRPLNPVCFIYVIMLLFIVSSYFCPGLVLNFFVSWYRMIMV